MGYAIMQIRDAAGNYVDWDGKLVALPDGTLGQIVVKKVLEEKVSRDEGLDVALPANVDTTVVTHSVPVGKAHKVFAYSLSPDSTGVDKFTIKIDATAKASVYTRTYAGGILDDYILIDNTTGSAPKVVTLVAHNADLATAHKASGVLLVEDVTDSMAQ
jgi:hypothetical protein